MSAVNAEEIFSHQLHASGKLFTWDFLVFVNTINPFFVMVAASPISKHVTLFRVIVILGKENDPDTISFMVNAMKHHFYVIFFFFL